MTTTAKMRPMTPVGGRPATPARTAGHAPQRHSGTLTTHQVSSQELKVLILQGTLVGCVLLGLLMVGYFFFGEALRASFMPIAGVPGHSAAPSGPGPTMFYRDRGDGTMVKMEIDGNGTRIKGVVDRNDVPLLQADKVREGWGNNAATSPNARVNALGSSFR